jgi:predicted ATPase/class 3 adenylate cyclase
MGELPSGVVSLLFSDIEGSTRLLDSLGPDVYSDSLELHRRLLREAFGAHGGVEVDCEGDAFFVVFAHPEDALAGAKEGQRRLALSSWPGGKAVRVRMGVHTGTPLLVDENYVGMDVHRAARIMAVAHGGQVVFSEATSELAGRGEFVDLGWHRLKDLTEPVRLYQLGEVVFPPLRSLNRVDLPIVAGPLLGRASELARIHDVVCSGCRLLTLTGPGGTGKTRLALQAAAELVDEFRDGVYFVSLAPLSDAGLVRGAVAQAIGLRPDDDLDAHLRESRLLLVLDNAEHLAGVDQVVPGLLVGEVALLVTSRAPLRLRVEQQLPVEPLADASAAELFVLRAAANGRDLTQDATVAALCRRLDNLPLAVELAAARTRLLTPAAILERLERALPLLTGGPRDAPERQQTLEATISWSHDLLGEPERVGFRRLAVFRDTFALAAAEVVTEAGLDTVEALVDNSLLKPIGQDRFLMLETVREFALDQLDQAGETTDILLAHADYYRQRTHELAPQHLGPGADELFRWYDLEQANTWAALDTLLRQQPDEALAFADDLGPCWAFRGQMNAGRDWLRDALQSTTPRARDYLRLGYLAHQLADIVEAEEAFEQALKLASADADTGMEARALEMLCVVSDAQNEFERAIEFGRRAIAAAKSQPRDQLQVARSRNALLGPLIQLGAHDEARRLGAANESFYADTGNLIDLAVTHVSVARIDHLQGELSAARERLGRALTILEPLDVDAYTASPLVGIASLEVTEGNHDEAVATYARALEACQRGGNTGGTLIALAGIATAAATTSPAAATQLWAAATSQLARLRAPLGRPFSTQAAKAAAVLRQTLGEAGFEHEVAQGRALTLDQAVATARALAIRPDQTQTRRAL